MQNNTSTLDDNLTWKDFQPTQYMVSGVFELAGVRKTESITFDGVPEYLKRQELQGLSQAVQPKKTS